MPPPSLVPLWVRHRRVVRPLRPEDKLTHSACIPKLPTREGAVKYVFKDKPTAEYWSYRLENRSELVCGSILALGLMKLLLTGGSQLCVMCSLEPSHSRIIFFPLFKFQSISNFIVKFIKLYPHDWFLCTSLFILSHYINMLPGSSATISSLLTFMTEVQPWLWAL